MSKFTVYISQEARVHTYRTVEAESEDEAKDMVLGDAGGLPVDWWEVGEAIGDARVEDICQREDSE